MGWVLVFLYEGGFPNAWAGPRLESFPTDTPSRFVGVPATFEPRTGFSEEKADRERADVRFKGLAIEEPSRKRRDHKWVVL